MAPLFQLLQSISSPSVLHTLCEELARTRRFREYAYRHNNGFFVLYVADPDLGLQVRLHVWAPERPPHHEQPHRHRMGFVSRVIAGELHSTLYERTTAVQDVAELYEELGVSGPTDSNFANPRTQLQSGPIVGLRVIGSSTHRAGDTYRFPSGGIHRVDTPAGFSTPVITLTVWEPAFQPSIAYEPATTGSQAKPMNVQRLDEATFDRIMQHVLTALPERT